MVRAKKPRGKVGDRKADGTLLKTWPWKGPSPPLDVLKGDLHWILLGSTWHLIVTVDKRYCFNGISVGVFSRVSWHKTGCCSVYSVSSGYSRYCQPLKSEFQPWSRPGCADDQGKWSPQGIDIGGACRSIDIGWWIWLGGATRYS